MSRLVLGVDPGIRGAVVAAHNGVVLPWLLHQDYIIVAGKAKTYDCAGIIRRLREAHGDHPDPPLMILEDVQGRAGWSVSTAVSLAKCHGMYIGIAGTLGWGLVVVQARAWHGRLGLPRSTTQTAKQQAAQWVSRNLPGLDTRMAGRFKQPHDGVVDAACLAAYGAHLQAMLETGAVG